MRTVLALAAFVAWGCCGSSEGNMGHLTKAQITELFTTVNVLGSFTGPPQPNLQIDRLEPGEYTLQFQLIEPTIDGLGQAAFAFIRWKVGGQQIQRIISVFSGAVISGVAEAVDVYLLDQSGRGSGPPHNDFIVTAAVAPGSTVVPLTGSVQLTARELVFFLSQPNVGYSLAGPVNGATLTLTTPYLGPPAGATTFYAQAPYKVGVTLSKGTRATIMQPPVLMALPTAKTIAAPGNFVVLVPNDAGIVSVLTTVAVNGANAQAEAANGVVQFTNPVFTLPLGEYVPQTFPGWCPVPPGTSALLLLNRSTTRSLDFAVQWGIEG